MAWHPIRQDHSIESVHWRVTLLHPLGQRHQAWIQAKDARLRTVLPRVETQQKFLQIGPSGVTVLADGAPVDQNVPAHLRYERHSAKFRLIRALGTVTVRMFRRPRKDAPRRAMDGRELQD